MRNLDALISAATSDNIKLPLEEADIVYYPNFFSEKESNEFFEVLHSETQWRQDPIKIFGKTYSQPRLTALYGNNGKPYTYSGVTMKPEPFTETHYTILKKITEITSNPFSSVLLNLYRNGEDSNGWHSDDEKELGVNPVIASVSFGATRYFQLKHKRNTKESYKVSLQHGSLLLMQGSTQHYWKHQILKTRRPVGPRINLTFRKIY